MERESTLNPGALMDTGDQPDSTLYNPENHDILLGNTLNATKQSIGVMLSPSLLDGALFIVSSGTHENEKIPNYWQRSVDLLTLTFNGVAAPNDDPKYFFYDLIKAYVDLYKIDLHLIVNINNKYIIIDKSNFLSPDEQPYNHENHAFIWCNADNTLCYPLYINDVNGRILTVFKTDEVFAWDYVESFVNQINQELLNTDQNQLEQHSNWPEHDVSHMAVDNTLPSTNRSTALVALEPATTPGTPAFIQHLLQQIYQLTNTLGPQLNTIPLGNEQLDLNIANLDQLSPQVSAVLIQKRLMLISELVQMAVENIPQNNDTTISSNIVAEDNNRQGNTGEFYKLNTSATSRCIGLVQSNDSNHFIQTNQNTANVQLHVPTHLSNTTEILEIAPLIAPTQLTYDAPEILKQPKGKWHYRNMKDLGKKEIPLLAGDGPQQTLIQVKVPRNGAPSMRLGVKIQTYDNRKHRSKVLVPEHTTVNMNSFSNDNDLNRLQFEQCNPMDYFDPVNRYVYLKISLAEHEAEKKDVRIHMFNLYQSGSINREIIATEQLKKCKLAFWFCNLENGVYEAISAPSLSCLIEET